MKTNEVEEKILAQMAEQQRQTADGANQCIDRDYPQGAALGREPKREGVRRAIQTRITMFERQQVSVDQLRELDYLLEKNPDVARILELVGETGVI